MAPDRRRVRGLDPFRAELKIWRVVGFRGPSDAPRGCPRSGRPVALEKPPEDATHGEVCLCDRRRDLLSGQGHHRRQRRSHPQGARPAGLDPQARSVHQRGSGHDEPVPARRGLRHRRRRRDGPRPRALRAIHRREPVAALQRHDRPDLPGGHRQGAPRRLPRRHGPGHPAHHQRDQGTDRAGRPRRRSGCRDRRGRRDRRRHRITAVPRGHPPDAQGRRAGECAVRPRDAAPRAGRHGRAQDEAHPALGQGAARHRHPAGRHRPALRPPGARRDPREDRALHRRRDRGRDSRRDGLDDLRGAAHVRGGRPRPADRARAQPRRSGHRARSRLVAGAGRADQGAQTGPRDRPGRQVHRAPGRLPLRHRGASSRGVGTRGRRQEFAGWTRSR